MTNVIAAATSSTNESNVIAIILMLGGIMAINIMPISQYPTVAPPSISVRATYTGGSAETVENSVTQIIEQEMTGFDIHL